MKKQEFIEKYGVEAYERYLAKCREYNKQHKKEKAEYYQENKEKRAEYYQTHKKELSEYFKKYRQTHKERKAEYDRQRYQTHKGEIAEKKKQYYKEYRQTHKKEIAEKSKLYYNTPMGRAIILLHNYNKADRIANRDKGDLTADWIIENIFNARRCHYCGQEFSWKKLGCDRKDSTLPHTKDNCVPCCHNCNSKKHTTSYEEYMETTN